MLTDFFRINLPYGMKRNADGGWFFFNRGYIPLGWNDNHEKNDNNFFIDYPVYTKYKGFTEAVLLKLSWNAGESVRRNDKGEIEELWFYNDATNPHSNPKYWDDYFEKIKLLSKCEVKK